MSIKHSGSTALERFFSVVSDPFKSSSETINQFSKFVLKCFAGLILVCAVAIFLNVQYKNLVVYVGKSPFLESKIVSLWGFVFVQQVEAIRFKDFFTAFFLALGSAFSLLTFFVLKLDECLGRLQPIKTFFLILSFGLFFAVADELLGIHETIGNNIAFYFVDPKSPSFKGFNAFVIGAYGLGVFSFLIYYRKYLLSLRAGIYFFAIGIFINVDVSFLDFVFMPTEERMELAASMFYFTGLSLYCVKEIVQFLTRLSGQEKI